MAKRSPVFMDTSGWIAVLNRDDRFHAQAAELLLDFGAQHRPLVTTDWVLAETGNGLARVAARTRFVQAVMTFREASSSRLIRVDEDVFHRALELYGQVDDKTWGSSIAPVSW